MNEVGQGQNLLIIPDLGEELDRFPARVDGVVAKRPKAGDKDRLENVLFGHFQDLN